MRINARITSVSVLSSPGCASASSTDKLVPFHERLASLSIERALAAKVRLGGEGTPTFAKTTPLRKRGLARKPPKFQRCARAPHPIWPWPSCVCPALSALVRASYC